MKPAHLLNKKQIAEVRKAFNKMELLGTEVTAKNVLAAAKKKEHGLDKYFNWGVSVERAKESYWLDQARNLISVVRIKVQYIEQPVRERAPIKLERGQYRMVKRELVSQDPVMLDSRERQLRAELNRVIAEAKSVNLHRSYPEWKEICKVVDKMKMSLVS